MLVGCRSIRCGWFGMERAGPRKGARATFLVQLVQVIPAEMINMDVDRSRAGNGRSPILQTPDSHQAYCSLLARSPNTSDTPQAPLRPTAHPPAARSPSSPVIRRVNFLSRTCIGILVLLVWMGMDQRALAQYEPNTGQDFSAAPATFAGPIIGVDWVASGDFMDAAGDLVEIAEVGFSAVRMPPVFDREFYALAESLGLTLFIELPITQLGAGALTRELATSDSLLTLLFEAGRGYASAGPIGITRLSDTRSTSACDAIDRVAERINQEGREAYYTTQFGEGDRCYASVDFVLDDHLSPFGDLERLDRAVERAGAESSIRRGVAGLGTAITRPDAQGWAVLGSSHAQARFMEDALNRVRGSSLSHVFVHRWRDQPSGAADLPDPWGRDYGLYTSESDPRPALQVVRGILLGLQDTFAFDRGNELEEARPWFSVLGWLMLSLAALMYAGSPRFRGMIPRYFFAHGFFRNAVREAREVLPLTSTAILTVTGLSIGLIGSFVIIGLKDLPLAVHWHRLLGEGTRDSITSIMNAPFVLTVLIGSATLISTSIWMGIWMVVTGRRARLLPSQALMLASWPRWQVLILLPLAMTLQATQGNPAWSILLLAMAWIATAFWATIRTSYDLFKITNVAPWVVGIVWLVHPLVVGAVAMIGWSLFNWDQVRFVLHLLQVG